MLSFQPASISSKVKNLYLNDYKDGPDIIGGRILQLLLLLLVMYMNCTGLYISSELLFLFF